MNASSPLKGVAIALLLSLSSGCGRKEEQYATESRAAHDIIWLLKMHELDHPGTRVTNLAQLFPASERTYPHAWHRRFLAYGKHAGFTNSVYEKYVFLPSGVTNRFVKGEILAVNAQPFPDSQELGRILISRIGTGVNDYRRTWFTEERIQKIFAEAGAELPRPSPMPQPPPAPAEPEYRQALFSKVRGRFLEFLLVNGIGGTTAGVIWCIALSLPFVLFVLLMLWMWRRGRH